MNDRCGPVDCLGDEQSVTVVGVHEWLSSFCSLFWRKIIDFLSLMMENDNWISALCFDEWKIKSCSLLDEWLLILYVYFDESGFWCLHLWITIKFLLLVLLHRMPLSYFVIIKHQHMRNITNFSLTNLASSDVWACLCHLQSHALLHTQLVCFIC